MNKFLQQNFNNSTLEYNLSKYDWPSVILEIIKEKYPIVTELETIHLHLSPAELSDVTKIVQDNFLTERLSKMIDGFAQEYISPLIGDSKYLIKRQPTLNLVIPNQSKIGRRLPFHQGIFYDNGRGQGTIWMPLTSCYDSNTMWVVDLEPSRALTKQVIEHKWAVEDFEVECLKHAYPVTLTPGKAHLFGQEIIHGNIENKTDITRMAIDWHILVEGEEYHRRYPGAFFRLPGDYTQTKAADTNKTYVCYLSNNTDFDRDIGKHPQRCTVEHYTNSQGIKHNGYQFENEYLNHLPIFEHLLTQDIDCLVVFSMYSINDELLEKALKLGKEIHFANEYLIMSTAEDLEKILTYKNFGVTKKGKLSFEV
jgi:hypothetical protein